MNSGIRNIIIAATAVIVVACSLVHSDVTGSDSAHTNRMHASSAVSTAGTSDRTPARPGMEHGAVSATAGQTPAVSLIAGRIERTLAALRSDDPAFRKAALDDLALELSRHDAGAAIAAILEFLASGRDAATGSDFIVGPGGVLPDAPSVRVMLLDQLGVLCRKNGTTEAVATARAIMRDFSAPDEWAICLRNTAWLDPDAASYLKDRTTAMLTHESWLENPSIGMLEAFDLVPFTRATELAPLLAEMMLSGNDELSRAATVALDRLSAASPVGLARAINDDPALMSELPLIRADLVAKADLTRAEDRAEVERYLSRRDISAEEKEKFIATLVEPGSFVSDNLLTQVAEPPSIEEDAGRLGKLREVFQEWMDGGRFPELHEDIRQFINDPGVTELIADARNGNSDR